MAVCVRMYHLLVNRGIKPDAAISNVEQERRVGIQAWPADPAAAYLASTYRLMQRNADADRIIGGVPYPLRSGSR